MSFLQTPRLIALDLDGTLLRSDKTISPGNHAAVDRAIQAGIHVVLASGRMHSATVKYALQMDFKRESYIASYNGALVQTIGGEKLHEQAMPADLAREIVDFAREGGLHLNCYLNDILYNEVHDFWTDLYFQRTGSRAQIVDDLAQFDGRTPTKLIIIDDAAAIAKLLPEMQERFKDRLHVLKTDDEYLEFMSQDADKGKAIEAIAGKLGVSRAECLAMGDNYNDLSMLNWAGQGIVMANARPELLSQFPLHAPHADEDGVAVIIDELIGNLRA